MTRTPPPLPMPPSPPVMTPNVEIQDRPAWAVNGFVMLVLFFLLAAAVLFFVRSSTVLAFLAGAPLVLLGLFVLSGFMTVAPNDARVYNLFGRYNGTWTEPGFWWRVPFNTVRGVSRKLNNFESPVLKVNDAAGTPIEVGTIVVWHVTQPAKALLQIEDYHAFVRIQAESAIRQLAAYHPYDVPQARMTQQMQATTLTPEEIERQRRLGISLRGDPELIARELRLELEQRLTQVGVHIDDARISHLAYAPEIASAMLQRQQSQAILDARSIIVEGAVQLTKSAIAQLQQPGQGEHQGVVIRMDDSSRAELAANLMVVLTSERHVNPVMDLSHSKGKH